MVCCVNEDSCVRTDVLLWYENERAAVSCERGLLCEQLWRDEDQWLSEKEKEEKKTMSAQRKQEPHLGCGE